MNPAGSITPATSAEEGARIVAARHFAEMLSHVNGARRGDDPEEIHAMRVAGRRLRAALRLFGDWLPADAARLDGETRWLMRTLGTVRDLDVQIELIGGLGVPEAMEPVVEILRRRRAGAHGRLVAALSSVRFRRMIAAFDVMLDDHRPSTRPLREVAPDLLDAQLKDVRRSLRLAKKTSTDEQWHEVRIRAKRLRYSVESLSPLAPAASRPVIRRLVRLQNRLGAYHDAVVSTQTIASLRRNAHLPRATVETLGVAGAKMEKELRKARAELDGVRAPVKTKRWKHLDRALKRRRPSRRRADMLEVVLVRHAIAGETDSRRWPNDADRPLTEEGEQKFRATARGLAGVATVPDVVLASPYARAWRTAELLTDEAAWPKPTETPELEPGSTSVETLTRLTSTFPSACVALVGHEPHLSRLASWFLTGSESTLDGALKKGGAVLLEFDGEPAPGAGRLRLWLTPKTLRAIRR